MASPILTPPADRAPPVDGIIHRVRTHNEENGWTVLVVERNGKQESWIGFMPDLREGAPVRATGEWETNTKWGLQFRVQNITINVPSDDNPDGWVLWLGGLVKGIGEGTIRKMVTMLGVVEMRAALDAADTDKLASVKGVSLVKAKALVEEWQKNAVEVTLGVELDKYGVRGALAKKVLKRWGSRAPEIVATRPFLLAIEIDGVGFLTADEIAKRAGVPTNSVDRMEAGLLHIIEEAQKQGHIFTTRKMLCSLTANLLKLDERLLEEGLDALNERQKIDIEYVAAAKGPHPEDRIYRVNLHEAEMLVAQRLAVLLTSRAVLRRSEDDTLGEGYVPETMAPSPEVLAEHAERAIVNFERDMKMTLAPIQKDAVRMIMREKVLVVTGGPGVGKCLQVGTQVLMFDGSLRAVEDVQDGELLMGPDSLARRVRGRTRGRGPLFEIRPVKGAPWVCNDVHVLTLVRSGGTMDGVTIDIPLDKYLALPHGAKWRNRGKLMRVPVDFPEVETAVDPYVFGLWLGDGATADVTITKPDLEVSAAVEAEAVCMGLRSVRRFDERNGCWETSIRGVEYHNNPFLVDVQSAVENGGKFIPDRYKINSRDRRLRLLAGLLDTNGYLYSGTYEIVSKWNRLANDVAFLARSLGFSAYVSDKWVQLKDWTEPRLYRRVTISGDMSVVPCRIARKQSVPRKQIKDVLRTGFEVVPLGDGEYAGFELDGDGRFLLGDFTVTHNTATVRAMLYALESAGFDIALCAPTGRAAKRINELTGRPAKTIHRLLEYLPQDGCFARRASHPLQETVVICDEASMLDSSLASSLFDALDDGARLILVGDVDQLPSVGPGAVLRDIIDSGVIPVVRLTQIFRQAEGSRIITNTHRVNQGLLPEKPTDPHSDFYWIEKPGAEEAVSTTIEIITKRLERRGISTKDCMVLTPQNKGKAGVKSLNQRLQAVLNPMGQALELGTTEETKKVYRVGDRVIQTKNDYDRDVYNGDVGWISEVDPPKPGFTVSMDNRPIAYEKQHFPNVSLAYAITTHKFQGSQSKAVIVIMLKEHFNMLSRQWIYTSLSRGEKLVILIADLSAVQMAIRETKREIRRTTLRSRIVVAVEAEQARRSRHTFDARDLADPDPRLMLLAQHGNQKSQSASDASVFRT